MGGFGMQLGDLQSAIKSEFGTRLLDGKPVLTNSNIDVIADYIAFLQFANETALDNVTARATPLTAIGADLDAWGATFGVVRLSSTNGLGSVQITGTAGATLPAGTVFTRCDGVEYVSTDAVTLTSATGIVSVQASDTGPDGNFQAGGALDMGSVVSGIGSSAVSQGIFGGADLECDADYRVRVLAAIRNSCRTGRSSDYEYWARLYAGVTRVCVQPLAMGAGSVKVYVMMDGSYPNGVPAAGDINAIQDMIFGTGGLAPLGIVGSVAAPTPVSVDVTVSGVGALSATEFQTIRDTLDLAFLDFFDCETPKVCRKDIEVALNDVITGCFEVTMPTGITYLAAGSVPILGVLSIV